MAIDRSKRTVSGNGEATEQPAATGAARPRRTAKIVARRSAIHGNGVFAVAPISKGERVIRYKGRLRTHAEVDAEYGDENETGHTFLFTLNDDYVLDANVDGNIARWINHSCKPNCESSHEEDAKGRPDRDRIYIEALRDIRPGEELTYNYGIVLDEPHTAKNKRLWACRCGAKRCTGTMLQPKR
jgi:SET domain-containing protein